MAKSKYQSLYFNYQIYPFKRPPEMAGAASVHPVVIVGGGPVGLALALDLARRGVATVVLEAKDSLSEGSRAICFSRRTLEILEPLGVARAVEEKGLPWTKGKSYFKDKLVFELEMPHATDDRFYPMYNLQQCWLEQFLVDQALKVEAIDLRWQSRVTGVVAAEDGVELSVSTPEGDYELKAAYVVACDGGRSAVRQLMGLKLNGASYEGRYLIADIRLKSDYPTERRAWFNPPSNPHSTLLMHKQPDDIWRIDYQLNDDEDAEVELEEPRIVKRIQDHLDFLGETGRWELDWYSVYKAHCLCLDSYTHGRVIFAGDAAHLVPIFGVRGLNSGMTDANNLAWKLAMIVKGLAPAALLQSYSDERRPATLEIFREAGKSTTFMTPPSRGYSLMREAALSLAVDYPFARPLVNPRQSQPYEYTESVLNSGVAQQVEFKAGPPIGAPLRHMKLSGGQGFLLEHLGLNFTGLYFAGDAGVAPEMAQAFKTLGGEAGLFTLLVVSKKPLPAGGLAAIADPEGVLFAAHDAVPGTLYLIRPDGHVCGRWRAAKVADLEKAIAAALMRNQRA
jgi:3-(3-hydroxy-phenyl)propionate hydroxylase